MIDALIGGLATGSLYAMLAVGFVLVFAATGVANFAQGSLAMIAAFFAFTAATNWGWPMVFAAPFGLAASTLSSYLIYMLGFGRYRSLIISIGASQRSRSTSLS